MSMLTRFAVRARNARSQGHFPATRRLAFEPLERRTLLDAAGLPTELIGPVPEDGASEIVAREEPISTGAHKITDQVLVGLKTDIRLADTGPLVESVAWPESLGTVHSGNTRTVYSIPSDDAEFSTVVQIYLPTGVTVDDAVSVLEPLGWVEFAEPNYSLGPDAVDSVPNDPYYADEPAFGPNRWQHDVMQTDTAWDWFQGNHWVRRPRLSRACELAA